MSRTNGKQIRIAQLGVAQPHAAGYRATMRLMPEVVLVAGYDLDLGAARGELQREGVAYRLYDDVAALLEAERPEAVIICLPPALTPSAIALAADAGCHVLAEKPCACTADGFLPAMAAIERAGVQFATGYLRRASPIAREMKKIAAGGQLGRLTSAEISMATTCVSRRNPDHWLFRREMSGGGILHWLGCHWIDLLWFVTEREVVAVGAMLDTLSGEAIDVEDTAVVTLRDASGMLATLNCAYVLDQGPDQIAINLRGTLGWLAWDGVGPELRVRSTHPDWATAPTRTLRFEPDPVGGYGGAMGIHVLRRFIASCRDGTPPLFTPADALRVLDAAEESSRTGRLVELTTAVGVG
ncbi:MAG: Gfo/Idh/MocA family protein [Thermomicrobiales bacterium]